METRVDEEEFAYRQGRSAYSDANVTARKLLHAVRPHDPDSMHVALYRLAGWLDAMNDDLTGTPTGATDREE